tara:strand:- start:1505 stop:2095 length:591 start_codon:yes stop_codon:yes gene_type:complete
LTPKESVVTPERFAKGFTYQDYVSQINVNKDRFEQYYETALAAVTEEDASAFTNIATQSGGAARILVLGEDWCPDVYRGMPMIARIAEAGGMDMKVFPRDANLDIMDEFLKNGEFQSIPTVVFYTTDYKYLCHWIERPVQVTEEMGAINRQIDNEMEGQDEQAIRRARRDKINSRFPDWQRESVKDIRQLLETTVG